MKKSAFFSILLVAALFLSSMAHAKGLELATQLSYPPNNILTKELYEPMAQAISEATGGDMVLHLYSPGNYVPINEEWKNLVSGMLDAGNWMYTASPKDFPWWSAILTPFMSKGGSQSTRFFWAAYENIPEVQAEVDKVGVPLLIYGPADYAFYSIKAPIRSPADLKGKRVIVLMDSDIQMVQAMGATPVFLQSTEAYVGLQRGMGEALLTAYPYAYSLRLQELAHYVTTIPLIYSPMFFSINRELWEDMTDAQRAALNAYAGLEASLKAAELLTQNQQTAMDAFREAGAEFITLSDEEIAAFRQQIEPLFQEYYIPWLQSLGLQEPEKVLQRLRALSDTIR